MRDLDLIHIADTGAIPPELVDSAYVAASPGGILDDTTLTDASFADTKAYAFPSLGGEFSPGRLAVLSAPADGGQAKLDAAVTVTVTPPVVPTPPIVWPGRAANNTSFLNLFPWHKTPKQGLDQNNPNPPAGMADPAPPPPAPAPEPLAAPREESESFIAKTFRRRK